jgi:effector-binding domain-containing protein
MSYHCEIKEQPVQKTLSIRTRTAVQDLPEVLGAGYGAITQYLGELGEEPIGPPFAAYHNMDMENLDVELGFPVVRSLPDRAEIKAGEIPGGRVATCLYTGPYSEMEPAYNALAKWIEDNGYEATGVAYELYLNDPRESPPAQTQIILPLKGDTYQIYPIGYVRRADSEICLEIGVTFRPALWWADRHDNEKSRSIMQTEPPYAEGKLTGVFACRAEYRPNPIAMTVCKLLAVDEAQGTVRVADIDAYDGTPVVDLKAYFPVCERVKEAHIPEWLSDWPEWLPEEGLGLYE